VKSPIFFRRECLERGSRVKPLRRAPKLIGFTVPDKDPARSPVLDSTQLPITAVAMLSPYSLEAAKEACW